MFLFCRREGCLFLLTLQNYDEKRLVPRNLPFFACVICGQQCRFVTDGQNLDTDVAFSHLFVPFRNARRHSRSHT